MTRLSLLRNGKGKLNLNLPENEAPFSDLQLSDHVSLRIGFKHPFWEVCKYTVDAEFMHFIYVLWVVYGINIDLQASGMRIINKPLIYKIQGWVHRKSAEVFSKLRIINKKPMDQRSKFYILIQSFHFQ